MEHYSFWSILPPILAIFLAIKTRQVFISLLFGIWLGWIILSKGDFFIGTINTIEGLVDVFKDAGNTRTIMFSSLVGALLAFIQRSGGVEGFIEKINKFLNLIEKKKHRNPRKTVQLLTWVTGISIFVESNISVLTTGSIFRPVFDRLKISREKLAYIVDSTSAPICILIPLNAWGAYIMSLLVAQGINNPLQVMIRSYPYNLYPIFAIIIVLLVIISQKDIGPMSKAERRVKEEGKLIRDGAKPLISSEIINLEKPAGIVAKARNMIIPICIMVGMMPIALVYTGWSKVEAIQTISIWQHLFQAFGQGSGSTAVLWSVLSAIFAGALLYRVQKILKTSELIDLVFKGISGLIPLALLMVLAFAIGKVCRELGTGFYVAEISKSWLSVSFLPCLIFIISSFIAFSTGTSWGTFAIMIPIGIQLIENMNGNLSLALAAILGGGIFGDHSSPISDTTIISSMASASDHIDHVKTQLPYAVIAGGAAAMIYLFIGLLTN